MLHNTLQPQVRPRELWAWTMYDFANSGFTTVVITALFNAYFVAVVANNEPWATLAWVSALSVSYALIALSAPFLGRVADRYAAKKKLLAISTLGCVFFTGLLYFAQAETLWLVLVCIIAANFFFGSGENLIAAFLPEIAQPKALGRVSGFGWGIGYLGGLTTLGLCLLYITWAEGQGQHATDFVPISMLITAGIFALASLPTFLFLRERARPLAPTRQDNQPTAWAQTLKRLHGLTDLRRFLLCSVFYQAGIQVVITLAAIYATQAMAFSTQQALLLIFIVNIMAAIGAIMFGYLQDRMGAVRTIALILLSWMLTIFLAWMAPSSSSGTLLFWIAATLAGLGLGGAQSGGRALIGLLSPPAHRAEFYGFWGLAVKLASIIGPLSYGLITWLTHGNHRQALLFSGIYFVVGLILLTRVDVARGQKVALQAG